MNVFECVYGAPPPLWSCHNIVQVCIRTAVMHMNGLVHMNKYNNVTNTPGARFCAAPRGLEMCYRLQHRHFRRAYMKMTSNL